MLIIAASDLDEGVRAIVVRGLGEAVTFSADAAGAIVKGLFDDSFGVVSVAFASLDGVTSFFLVVMDGLIRCLESGDSLTRDRAVDLFGKATAFASNVDAAAKARAFAALEPFFDWCEVVFWFTVWKIFEGVGEAGVLVFGWWVRGEYQYEALRFLQKLGFKVEKALFDFVQVLATQDGLMDREGFVIFQAIGVLALDALTTALKDDRDSLCSGAALMFGRMGCVVWPALQALFKARTYEKVKQVRNDMDMAVTWIQDAAGGK